MALNQVLSDYLSFYDSTLLAPEETSTQLEFLQYELTHENLDRAKVLGLIPRSLTPSYGPMSTLSALISRLEGPWPVFELQRTYTEFWKLLPEDAKAGRGSPKAEQLLDHVLQQCKTSYAGLTGLLVSDSDAAALVDPESGRSVSHSVLARTVRDFQLPNLAPKAVSQNQVVAISLPNGPLFALTVLATATYYTAAPIAHGSGVGAEQFKADVLQSHSSIVLASKMDVERLQLRDAWLKDAGVNVYLVELTEHMSISVRCLDGSLAPTTVVRPRMNEADSTGILLFTSGTSGTKKLVPLTIHSMVCGVAFVIESWGLTASSRCLNQMPLNHVGGLIRNLFAPVMSGGSVICCSAFDANLFWDCVEDYSPTWYYASPSMHSCILDAARERPEAVAKSRIRLVCNAAGGLLPSLACQIRDTFSRADGACTVLPSYGMTECMPISTPPLTYQLDRTGTSGISVGPEIAILDGKDHLAGENVIGRISVRGAPVFGGYLKTTVDKTCFNQDGWFDTGDMGYLCPEGYLYVTGRSKEVINRGGELISPFEVEEAITIAAQDPKSSIYGRLDRALAFSVSHNVLQEVVGIAVVTPAGSRRACLRGIQESVKSSLSQVKVPVLVVYMEGGLPTNNNKVLRIRLAERLGLPELSDDTPAAERHYQAVAPPANTPLSKNIASELVQITHDCLEAACRRVVTEDFDVHVRTDASDFYPELLLAPKSGAPPPFCTQPPPSQEALIGDLAALLNGYNVPSKICNLEEPFPRKRTGSVDDDAVDELLSSATSSALGDSTLCLVGAKVAAIFAQILSLPIAQISACSDFFDMGGDSMKAGRLLTALRKEFQIRLPIDLLFVHRQVASLSALIEARSADIRPTVSTDNTTISLPGCDKTFSSTNPFLMVIQLLPLIMIYPMKRALTWTIFMYCLTKSQDFITNESVPGRLMNLVVSMAIGRAITKTVAPLVAVCFKWIVMGRYKEGIYPMWGAYHTRWWLCQKVIALAGMGVFSMTNTTRVLYFRALGARIGKNVSLAKGATIGEYDLLTIDDGVALERCIVRPFAAERNTSMYLGRITLGANSSVGLGSIVAAGTVLPRNACIGPNSSSWEIQDANEANRNLSTGKVPKAHWAMELLVGVPIAVFINFVAALPWLAGLTALVTHEPTTGPDMLRLVILWFASSKRVGFHYLALVLNAALGSVFLFLGVVCLKKLLDACYGKIQPGSADRRSSMTKFRMNLIKSLMPAPQLHKVSELFGGHYEATSMLMRAMGAKVGKRVYWPGTGPTIQDYDLLEVGDDVVFGSRSHLVTSDGTGSDYVRIGNGAMVADRVVLLPGVTLENKTVMGSGALTRRDGVYHTETTWVGSKKGEAVCLTQNFQSERQDATPGNRLSQYQDTIERGNVFSDSNNSSSTTLVKGMDFGRSSSDDQKPGKKISVRTNPVNSEMSSLADAEPQQRSHTIRMFGKQIDIEKTVASSTDPRQTVITITKIRPASDDATADTSPFGRAFYHGLAPYRVWGMWTIFAYSTLTTVITAFWWNIGSISAVQVVANLFTKHHEHFLGMYWWRPLSLYAFFTAIIALIMTAQAIIVLAFIIGAKWALMGRRTQGNYDWDKSSYCQRWQLFLTIEKIRRHCYGGHGILGMLTGTHYAVLYFRALGATIGKDCSLFSGGLPSLMFTEPDLLTLGDRVSVDDASLVGHINTRGKFDLNPLSVGSRSVLRSGSRLLSGARMEPDTCLLEHTLIMAGDVVDAGSTSQGWPAEEFPGARCPTLEDKVGV